MNKYCKHGLGTETVHAGRSVSHTSHELVTETHRPVLYCRAASWFRLRPLRVTPESRSDAACLGCAPRWVEPHAEHEEHRHHVEKPATLIRYIIITDVILFIEGFVQMHDTTEEEEHTWRRNCAPGSCLCAHRTTGTGSLHPRRERHTQEPSLTCSGTELYMAAREDRSVRASPRMSDNGRTALGKRERRNVGGNRDRERDRKRGTPLHLPCKLLTPQSNFRNMI